MRAEPPRPPRRQRSADDPVLRRAQTPRHRCQYLEQILREPAWGGLLTRYKADCHVDRRTHSFTGRHPSPPCITDQQSCALYRRAKREEGRDEGSEPILPAR